MKLRIAVLFAFLAGCQTPGLLGDNPATPIVKIQETNDELNQIESQAWLQSQKNYLKSLYHVRIDPYFGKADHDESCETSAVKFGGENSSTEVTYAKFHILTTDSGATGVCDPKMQSHKMTLVFAACHERARQFIAKVICPVGISAGDECEVTDVQIRNYCSTGRRFGDEK